MLAEAQAHLLRGKRTQFKTYPHQEKEVYEEILKKLLPPLILAKVRSFGAPKKPLSKKISIVKVFLPQEWDHRRQIINKKDMIRTKKEGLALQVPLPLAKISLRSPAGRRV